MLYALLFLPALIAIVYVVTRRHTTVAETAAAAPNPFEELDSLLAELEEKTLDQRTVDELNALAERLERVA